MLLIGFGFAFGQNKKKGTRVAKVITSDIRWWGYKVVKTEPTTHYGTLNLKSGKFIFEDDVKLVGGEFIIDMRSLLATDLSGDDQKKLTDDLKGPTFFDVKKFPTAKFKLVKIEPSNNTEYNSVLYGDITIKGIRKSITIPADVMLYQNSVKIQSAKFTLNRQTFKAFYKSSIKDYLIKDEMDIQFTVATK